MGMEETEVAVMPPKQAARRQPGRGVWRGEGKEVAASVISGPDGGESLPRHGEAMGGGRRVAWRPIGKCSDGRRALSVSFHNR